MTKPVSRYKDGTAYNGHKMYLGAGVQRSCGKCGVFFPPAQLKKWRAGMLACPACLEKKK